MPGPNLPPLIVLGSDPPPPRRSSTSRYGLLYPLGILGLVVLIGWVGWFAYRAWTMRDVWRAVAILHDPARPIDDRLASARFLADDPRVTEDQIEPMVFGPDLPIRARMILADGLVRPSVLHHRSPRRIDRFEIIPLPLRLALLMRMAEAAEPDVPWPATPLERMGVRGGDESTRVLSLYCRSAAFGSAQAASELQEAADGEASGEGLASILSAALESDDESRRKRLDQATRWLNQHHPAVIEAGGIGPNRAE